MSIIMAVFLHGLSRSLTPQRLTAKQLRASRMAVIGSRLDTGVLRQR
jgi:hypothetical protein